MGDPMNDAAGLYATAQNLMKDIEAECRRLANHCGQCRISQDELRRAAGELRKRRARAALEVNACDMIQWRESLQGKLNRLVKLVEEAGAHVDVDKILAHCPEEVGA
jgi:predicted dienelactone hydrolase